MPPPGIIGTSLLNTSTITVQMDSEAPEPSRTLKNLLSRARWTNQTLGKLSKWVRNFPDHNPPKPYSLSNAPKADIPPWPSNTSERPFYLSKGLQKLPIPSTTPEPGSKLPNVSRTFQYVRSIILHLWNPPQPATQLKQALRPAASHPVTFMGRPLHTAIADENSLLSGSIQFIPPTNALDLPPANHPQTTLSAPLSDDLWPLVPSLVHGPLARWLSFARWRSRGWWRSVMGPPRLPSPWQCWQKAVDPSTCLQQIETQKQLLFPCVSK